ncbi:hypothetical protein OAG80_01810 [Akkermansiaceae bacterium]|nr:hypothetical protein [Akkermansiaceae bacterium]
MISRSLTLFCAFSALAAPTFAQKILQFDDINNFRINAGDFVVNGVANQDGPIIDLPKSDPSGTDILRFSNGDLMHGSFAGIKDGVLWSRPDMGQDVRFDFKNLRQVVFKGGQNQPKEPLSPFVSLLNGDVIPGEIISLDDKTFVLESTLAGRLSIPRNQIKSFTPSPFGGQLHYAGPFTSDNWLIVEQKEVEAPEDEEDAPEPAQTEEEGEEAEKEEVKEKPASWLYSGASLYSTNTRPIALDAKLPDVGRLRFKLAWRNRLSANIAFHADFTRPHPRAPEPVEGPEEAAEDKPAEAKEDAEPAEEKPVKLKPLEFESLFDLKQGDALQSVAWLPANSSSTPLQTYGSSYVLTFSSNYVTLHYNSFDEEGNPIHQSRRGTRIGSTSYPESGEAEIDIRFDRKKKAILLYVDGQYSNQWSEVEDYAGKGGAIGFGTTGNCRIKISDIAVSSWSGTPDAARSMEHDERDIALLINGTDRFSGKITAIADGNVSLKSPYAEMSIPLNELSEVHLHRSGLADTEESEWAPNSGIIIFNPIGRLTFVPSSSDKMSISGKSSVLGDIKVDLKAAALLQFADSPEALSDWVTDF